MINNEDNFCNFIFHQFINQRRLKQLKKIYIYSIFLLAAVIKSANLYFTTFKKKYNHYPLFKLKPDWGYNQLPIFKRKRNKLFLSINKILSWIFLIKKVFYSVFSEWLVHAVLVYKHRNTYTTFISIKNFQIHNERKDIAYGI